MRPIKFRAWDKWNKKWTYFSIGQLWELGLRDLYIAFCINGETFYEFTGLLDKNGKEIYEGDIVKHIREGAKPTEVIFDRGGFRRRLPNRDFDLYAGYFDWSDNFEVIGNIYENPELLQNGEPK